MTRDYAARRLLEHGSLTLAQFMEITRWGMVECRNVLRRLSRCDYVFFTEEVGSRRRVYHLREDARA